MQYTERPCLTGQKASASSRRAHETRKEIYNLVAPMLGSRYPEATRLKITAGSYGCLSIRARYRNRQIRGVARNPLAAINRFFADAHLKIAVQPCLVRKN